MKATCLAVRPMRLFAVMLVSTGVFSSHAAVVNHWTNHLDGLWHEPFWSLGILPGSDQRIELTNQPVKTVTIAAATGTLAPASLHIQDLLVSGPNRVVVDNLDNAVMRVNGNVELVQYGILEAEGSEIQIGADLRVITSEVNQNGGLLSITGKIDLDGQYSLLNGTMQAAGVLNIYGAGTVVQSGGSVQVPTITASGGTNSPSGEAYKLLSGTIESTNIIIGGGTDNTFFLQTGGTNATRLMNLQGYFGQSGYMMEGGALLVGSAEVHGSDYNSATLHVSGGSVVVSNELSLWGGLRHGAYLYPGEFVNSGGEVTARNLEVQTYGRFYHSNGNTFISESLTLNAINSFHRTESVLQGGVIACNNLHYSGSGGDLLQLGGTLIVSNVLSFGGFAANPPLGHAVYHLDGGALLATHIEIDGVLEVNGTIEEKGRITNNGYFRLGGELRVNEVEESLGRFILASNAIINFGEGSGKLTFAASADEPWAPGVILYLLNWDGGPGGGGDEIKFGNSHERLSAGQIAQLRFVNAAGFPGTNDATILASGEVVPALAPRLEFTRIDERLIFTWSGDEKLAVATDVNGPYQVLPTASSPYQVSTTNGLTAFFRLSK